MNARTSAAEEKALLQECREVQARLGRVMVATSVSEVFKTHKIVDEDLFWKFVGILMERENSKHSASPNIPLRVYRPTGNDWRDRKDLCG